MANRYKKKRETTNKTKDWITDYYQTGREFDKENRRRREKGGRQRAKRRESSFRASAKKHAGAKGEKI